MKKGWKKKALPEISVFSPSQGWVSFKATCVMHGLCKTCRLWLCRALAAVAQHGGTPSAEEVVC